MSYTFETADDKFYIGQSLDIDTRYKDHCSALRRGSHHSRKMQDLYNKYSKLPTLYWIEEVTTDLNTREIYWISEFNSFRDGLNGTPGGKCAYEEDSASALHSKKEYVEILMLLAHTDKLPSEISKIMNINVDIISAIAEGTSHKYLKYEFPEEYETMLRKLGSSIRKRRLFNDNVYVDIYKDMAYTNMLQQEIADKHGVSLSVVKDISRGKHP